MILIAGLGNPGIRYKNTRHNIGFETIDKIVLMFQFPTLNLQSNFNAQISKGFIGKEKVILAKPLTFMNLSGKSISKIIQFYKIDSQKVIVIHDDIDIPLGKIKIIKSKGAGGHKGVASIIKETGTKNFIRIRIGVSPEKKPLNAEAFVLQKFRKEEKGILNESLEKTAQAIEVLIKESLEKSSSLFSK